MDIRLAPPQAHTENPTEKVRWDNLSKDVQRFITHSCDVPTLAKLAKTSQSNCKLVFNRDIQEFGASDGFRRFTDIDTYLATFDRYSNLKSLDLKNVRINHQKINDDQFNRIINVVQEKKFEIEELDLHDLQLKFENSPAIPSLLKLNLRGNTAITDTGLNNILAGNEIIQYINLSLTKLPLKTVRSLPSLLELDLYNNANITNENLKNLLKGNNCIQVLLCCSTNLSLESVGPLPSLLKLNLAYSNITDIGLRDTLAGNTRIQTLYVHHTNLSLELVNPLPTLTSLCINSSRVTAQSLNNVLKGNTCIEWLQMWDTHFRLEAINPLPSLLKLDIAFNKTFSDTGLNHVLAGNNLIQDIKYTSTNISEALVRDILSHSQTDHDEEH